MKPAQALAERILPLPAGSRAAREAVLLGTGVLLVSLLAQWEVRLPFSPVPVTGQTLGVLLAGGLLGARRGLQAMLLYLGAGLAGLPVFAGGGAGPFQLLGPTGGYLLGFPAAAWVAGLFAGRGWNRTPWRALPAFAAGNLTIYLFGLPWLALFVGWNQAPALGVFPFLAGDAVKILLAAALLPLGWKIPSWAGINASGPGPGSSSSGRPA